MNRIVYLDGLKGFAAFCVLIHHFYLVFYQSISDVFKVVENIPVLNMFVNGQFAVCLFIVISNYIFAKLIGARLDIDSIQRSLSKRYFRLAIPIAFIVVIVAVMYYLGAFRITDMADPRLAKYWNELRAVDFFKQALLSPLGFSKVLGPCWMLEYIFLGNLFIVLTSIMLKGVSIKTKMVIYALVLLLAMSYSVYWACVFAGAIIYEVRSSVEQNGKGKIYAVIVIIVSQLIVVMSPSVFGGNKWFNVLAAILFFIGILWSEFMQCFFSSKIFVYLGNNSLAIYLTHWPIICSLSCILFLISGEGNILLVINLLVTIIATLILSGLYTRHINVISEKIVDKITKNLK